MNELPYKVSAEGLRKVAAGLLRLARSKGKVLEKLHQETIFTQAEVDRLRRRAGVYREQAAALSGRKKKRRKKNANH